VYFIQKLFLAIPIPRIRDMLNMMVFFFIKISRPFFFSKMISHLVELGIEGSYFVKSFSRQLNLEGLFLVFVLILVQLRILLKASFSHGLFLVKTLFIFRKPLAASRQYYQ
jgi:hypothetical protein